MSKIVFPILGDMPAPMLGRTRILQRALSELTKKKPSNLSIIGPRFSGKSVLMHAIAQRMQGGPFKVVLPWHLGHVAPQSDGEFIAQLSELLRNALAGVPGEFKEYREYLQNGDYSTFQEVTDLLDNDRVAILMLWDGFDKPLGQGLLSRQLWDQMRTVFGGKCHRIVTATRAPLSELIRGEDAISSPFWNIFDPSPVRVECFDTDDRDAILAELKGHQFQPGAKTELQNWSSGFPPLFLELLNQVQEVVPKGQVTNEAANAAAQKTIERLSSNVIAPLWNDCPALVKDAYRNLLDHPEQQLDKTDKAARDCLISRGLATQSGNKLHVACRMMEEHARATKSDAGSMQHLFGVWEDYRGNIRGLLERRLSHLGRFDDRLWRLVARTIEDIPDFPDDCLNSLSNIEELALKIIWQREFGSMGQIPLEIVHYWTEHPRSKERTISEMIQSNRWAVPTDRLAQLSLLQFLTGSKFNFETKAKTASKNTYVLLNAIHTYRNRTQHPEGEELHLGVAVAAVMTCIELLACLEREV